MIPLEYIGNIHIHSLYSDGSKAILEIASTARKRGLDFIIINDHYNLNGLINNEEGYIYDVLVLIGMEVNDTANHYLAMNIKEVVANNTCDPQQVINEVNRQQGLGVIAHPFEKGSPFHDRIYPWRDFSVKGFQGIEIWNYLSNWRDGITNFFKGIYLLYFPHKGITRPYQEALKFLDDCQKKGIMVNAFGGSDAHEFTISIGPLKFKLAPYHLCFKSINTHIITDQLLTGKLETDKTIIYDSLYKGSFFIADDYYKNSRGFNYELSNNQKIIGMGEKTTLAPGMYLKIKTPAKAMTRLIKNGQVWQISKGLQHKFKVSSPGVYRVEVYLKRFFKYYPWIFSNSIWITE